MNEEIDFKKIFKINNNHKYKLILSGIILSLTIILLIYINETFYPKFKSETVIANPLIMTLDFRSNIQIKDSIYYRVIKKIQDYKECQSTKVEFFTTSKNGYVIFNYLGKSDKEISICKKLVLELYYDYFNNDFYKFIQTIYKFENTTKENNNLEFSMEEFRPSIVTDDKIIQLKISLLKKIGLIILSFVLIYIIMLIILFNQSNKFQNPSTILKN